MQNTHIPLCYRCEYRAQFLENGRRPRHECGDGGAVYGCYMFRPVKPLVLKPRDNDTRPITLNLLSGRVEAVRVADVELRDMGDGEILPMWVLPDNKDKDEG